MRKNLLIILVIAFCIFVIGFGMEFSKNINISEAGLWTKFIGSFIMAIVTVFIFIDFVKKNKNKKEADKKENDIEKNNRK